MEENIRWDTTTHEYRPRTNDWQWAVGILGSALAVATIILGNITFGIFIVIATVTIIIVTHQKPVDVAIEISPKGVRVNNDLYLFSNLKHFAIDETHNIPYLILYMEKTFLPYIRLIIDESEVRVHEVRQYLNNFADEEDYEHTLIDSIIFYLGF